MKKLHLACGYERFEGWENHDRDVDMAKPLPFDGDSIDFIFNHHALEHVTQQEGYRFLGECYRILRPGGVLRIGVPDIRRILTICSVPHVFGPYVVERGGSARAAVEGVIFEFGHQAIYTADLLDAMLRTIGFRTTAALSWDDTAFAELRPTLAKHHRDHVLWVETTLIDACKPTATGLA